MPNAWLSVSATTRNPRPGEIDGSNYLFVSTEQFEDWIATDGLLEWACVHAHYYGTPRAPVQKQLDADNNVFLEIDTQGAFQVMESVSDAVSIFIDAPSMNELQRRLVGRGTESEDQLQRRLATAKHEIAEKMRYNYQLVNDDVESAADQLYRIIKAEEQKCQS